MNELEPTINQRRRRWGGRRRWKGRSLKVERTKNVSVSFLLNDLQRLLPERKCHHHLHLLFHHHHHHHPHHHVFFFTRTFFHPTRPETIRNSAGIDLKWDRIGWIRWIGWVGGLGELSAIWCRLRQLIIEYWGAIGTQIGWQRCQIGTTRPRPIVDWASRRAPRRCCSRWNAASAFTWPAFVKSFVTRR